MIPRRVENIIGRKFNRLTVIAYSHQNSNGMSMWNCECECGNKSVVGRGSLVSSSTKSCGCLWIDEEKQRRDHFRNLMINKVFGKLTVIKVNHVDSDGTLYECQCECGTTVTVRGGNLNNGTTNSCGCLKKEIWQEMRKTHGLSGHPLYGRWANMITRCYNSNVDGYHNLGHDLRWKYLNSSNYHDIKIHIHDLAIFHHRVMKLLKIN